MLRHTSSLTNSGFSAYFKKVNLTGAGAIDVDHNTELTSRDWQLLIAGAESTSYPKNATVILEGVPNGTLFRIRSGTARVEKMLDGNPVVVAHLNAGAMFGEMSVLLEVLPFYSLVPKLIDLSEIQHCYRQCHIRQR